jgi:hypothetical protein
MWCGLGCGAVWCDVVGCGVVWCDVVWCGVVWYYVVWCGVCAPVIPAEVLAVLVIQGKSCLAHNAVGPKQPSSGRLVDLVFSQRNEVYGVDTEFVQNSSQLS